MKKRTIVKVYEFVCKSIIVAAMIAIFGTIGSADLYNWSLTQLLKPIVIYMLFIFVACGGLYISEVVTSEN